MTKFLACLVSIGFSALLANADVVVFMKSNRGDKRIVHWVSTEKALTLSFNKKDVLKDGGVTWILLSVEEAVNIARRELNLRHGKRAGDIMEIELQLKKVSKKEPRFLWYYEIKSKKYCVYILMDGTCVNMTFDDKYNE